MVALIALLIAAATAAEDHDLWLDALGAPVAAQHPAAVAHWRWSPQCAPARSTADGATAPCQGEVVRITVVNPAGEPLPGVQLRWGPDAMRREVPENLLPTAVTAPDGTARLLAPPGERLWARVSGAAWASPWRELGPGHYRIVASPGDELEFTSTSPGWIRMEWWPRGERLWGSWVIPPGEGVRVWVPAGLAGTALAWGHDAPPFATAISSRSVLDPPPGVRIEVHAADSEGRAIAGVQVSTLLLVPGAPRAVERRCLTGDDGSCTLAGLPAGPATLEVAKDGWVPRTVAVLATPPLASVTVALDRGRQGIVRVRSAAGGPVAQAEIFLKPSHVALGTTDALGVARLSAVPADEAVTLGISAQGYVEGSALLAAEDEAELEVVLTPAVRLTGNVAFADGTPPPGGIVTLEWPDGTSRDEPLPGNGRIELAGLPPGRIEVEFRADGATPRRLPPRELPAGETWDFGTVVLERGATVTGTVVARETGEGIANARLRLPRPHQFGPRVSAVRGDFVEAASGEGGTFELRGVPAGGHPILVEAPGFAPRLVREVVVRAQEQAPVEVGTIALDRDLVLEVHCAPAHRCRDRALLLLGGEANDWAFVEEHLSDGRARFASVPADDLTLQLRAGSTVRATRAVTVAPTDRLTVVEVKLEEGRLEGVVRWDGRPANEGVVELRELGSPAPPAVILSSSAPGATAPSTQTVLGSAPEELFAPVDGEGRFLFTAVAPGRYQATVGGPWGLSPPRTVEVLANTTTVVVLDFPGGRVAGEVVDAENTPQDGTVQIFSGSSLVGSASLHDGQFAMAGLAPGEYEAVARTAHGTGRGAFSCRSGELARLRIVVVSESSPETAVRIVDWVGRPVGGAMVLGLTAAGWRLGFTDSSGLARPGGHQLLAAAAYRADLGFAAAPCPAAPPCELAFASASGALEIPEPPDVTVALNHASGVPLHLLAGVAGMRWVTPCRITGLPAGTYTVTVGSGPPHSVVVRARQVVTVGR